MNNEKILDISWNAILKIVLVVIFFYVLYQVRNILILFIFAFIISILFNPAIEFLKKFKIPRAVRASIAYLVVFGFLIVGFYFIALVLVSEIEQFSRVLPSYIEELSPFLKDVGIYAFEDVKQFIETIKGSLREMARALFSAIFVIFGGIATTFFIIIVAFFLSLEGKSLERAVIQIFPKKYENYVVFLWKKSQEQVSQWFLTRILACIFVGALIFISAIVLGINYPLSFGLLAGIFNFIPYIGPLVSGVLIFLIVATDNIIKAIIILIIFLVVQQIENSILSPILSKKFMGISPALVIMALAIGGTIWGFMGALLAVPLAGILFEFFKEFLQKRREEEAVML